MKKLSLILAVIMIAGITALPAFAAEKLSKKQKSIVLISTFTAAGKIADVRRATVDGLGAGLTVNEIKEIFIHIYAYTGFPKSLNGLIAFMNVMEEREKQGIKDEIGREASPIPADLDRDAYGARVRADLIGSKDIPPPSAYQRFAPTINKFLKEHLFADIFARDIFDFQTRELITISALAGMEGTEPQLKGHLGIAMRMGLTEPQLQEFVTLIRANLGGARGGTVASVLRNALAANK